MKKLYQFFLLFCLFSSFAVQVRAQGELWGMASPGGPDNLGFIFKTNADGTGYAIKKAFTTNYPGQYPSRGGLTLVGSKLYGLAQGGTNNMGVLFEYDPAGNTYVKKVDFDGTGNGPWGRLLLAANGKLYGVTWGGGSNDKGTLFEYDPATGILAKKIDFDGVGNGANPTSGLIETISGKLYGTTSKGGSNNNGTLFEFDPTTSVLIKKIDFNSTTNGSYPEGGLVAHSNGKLYGTTTQGGPGSRGTLFEYDPTSETLTQNINFSGTVTGSQPQGGLIEFTDGKLYGMTSFGGGSNRGILFEYDPTTTTLTSKVDFSGTANGANPLGRTLIKLGSKLYGTTTQGGNNDSGVLFEYEPATNSFTKKVDFDTRANGNSPCDLMQVGTSLYGTTQYGGIASQGVLFEYDPTADSFTKKVDFSYAPEGAAPYRNGLTQAANKKLYGVTGSGGKNGQGVLFELDPVSGAYVKRADFSSATTGSYPIGSLIEATNGKLYGMAYQGGSNDMGTLFEYDPATTTLSSKADFSGTANGSYPEGGLVQIGTKLYGTTGSGGVNDMGILFEYDIEGTTLIKKIDFSGMANGEYPLGRLAKLGNKLYGITNRGGIDGFGILYEFDTEGGGLIKKIDFDWNTNGANPEGGLTLAGTKLYGATVNGGDNGDGVLFEFNPEDGSILNKSNFDWNTNGANPVGSLTLVGTKLLGIAPNGGLSSMGTFFEFNPTDGSLVKKLDLDGTYGDMGDLLFVKANQTITFNTIADKSLIDVPFALTATASSGLNISYGSSNPSVATVSGNTVTITGVGTTTITADQPGNDFYHPATQVSQTLTVNKLPTNHFKVAAIGESCKTSNNGSVSVTAVQAANYTATLTGNSVNKTVAFTSSGEITGLPAGTYTVCITIDGQADYKQCFDAVITEPKDLSVYSVVDKSLRSITLQLAGGGNYQIELNGKVYTTSDNQISLPLQNGNNSLKVMADKTCQGVVEKLISLSDEVLIYPNPFESNLNIRLVPADSQPAAVEIRSLDGKVVYSGKHDAASGSIDLALVHLTPGIYVLKLSTGNSETIYKILKK